MEDSDVTAINIDKDVTSVHFSITGKSWAMLRKYFAELIPKVRLVLLSRVSTAMLVQD